jgi:hypothetical protein
MVFVPGSLYIDFMQRKLESVEEEKERERFVRILVPKCGKGMVILFLNWICETYLAKRQKKGKKKSVNQY